MRNKNKSVSGNIVFTCIPYTSNLAYNQTTKAGDNLQVYGNYDGLPDENDTLNICTYSVSGSG